MRFRTALSLTLLLGLAPAPSWLAFASEPGWIPLGPAESQEVRSLAVLPGSPSLVLAAATAGVFGTTDGSRWQLLNGGSLPLGVTGSLHSSPLPGSPVYLVSDLFSFVTPNGGVFRSRDAGGSWTLVKETGGRLAVAPSDPETLYLAGPDDATSSRHGAETSRDGGATWTSAAPFPSFPDAAFVAVGGVAVAPSDPDRVFVLLEIIADHGYPDTISLLRSDDGGASWAVIDGPSLGAQGAKGLILDPLDPATIYLVLTAGIYRSTDGGATWEARNDGLPAYPVGPGRRIRVPVQALAIDPAAPPTLYAAVAADPLNDIVSGVFRTDDGGASWTRAAEGLPPALAIHDLALGGPDSPIVYLGTSRGVYRSDDRGAHWSHTTASLPTPVSAVAIDPAAPHTLFAGTADQRLFTSDDGGQQWRPSGAGIPLPRSDAFANPITILSIAPTDRSVLFTSTLGGFFVDGGSKLARSIDGGTTWETVVSPGDVRELLVDPRDPDRVLAGARSAGGVFVSNDLGGSWDRLLGGRLGVLAQAPSNPEVLYSWIAPYPVPPGKPNLCRSTDGGGVWECSRAALASDQGVAELAVDPRSASRLLAAVAGGGAPLEPVLTRICESTDGGTALIPIALPFAEGVSVTDLAFDPRDPEVVWTASTGGGVFRSLDGGRTWAPLNRGLTHPDIHELAFDPSGRVLVAATSGGLFRFSESAGPAPPPAIDWIADPALSGFRIKVRIDQGGGKTIPGTVAPACIPETICVAGALPGRGELFVRIVGPKPNGRLWPTLVKFSTSRIEVWIQQLSTGELRYYELSGASPGLDELPGLFDRFGFVPD